MMYELGYIVRLIATIVLLLLPIGYKLKTILIFLTDSIDCRTIELLHYLQNKPVDRLCKSYKYQSVDKAVDLFTYLLVYLYLGLSPLYLFIILWRLVGISLFYLTSSSAWLIVCPDLFKELLLYSWYIHPINTVNFSVIIVLKIIFEYVWHTKHNPNVYKTELDTSK
jgi:hypothetical protein